jgi:SAM-dependent methyltransferase
MRVRPDEERERLRETFDRAADLYHRARPDYPEALYDDLVALAGLRPGDRLLEVGCATGKATLPLARRGFRITCLELGPELAAAARQNLTGFPVQVVQGRFEDWVPDQRVSLVFAATAWRWIDPAVRYERAWQALRPGGHLAVWEQAHVFPDGGDPFFREIQEVYEEIGEGLPPGTRQPRPGELADDQAEIEASGRFEVAAVRQYDWERVYDAEEYIELLSTFSGHLSMTEWQRERLFGEIRRRLAGRPDRSVRRHWGAVLHVAERREGLSRLGRVGPDRRRWLRVRQADNLANGSALAGLGVAALSAVRRHQSCGGLSALVGPFPWPSSRRVPPPMP